MVSLNWGAQGLIKGKGVEPHSADIAYYTVQGQGVPTLTSTTSVTCCEPELKYLWLADQILVCDCACS